MRRALRVSLLVFQALWLNVLLPGHTRGIIATPGDAGAPVTQAVASDCCHTDTRLPKDRPGKDAPDKPAKRAAHCAICFFAAHLSTPPVIDLSAPRLGLTGTLAPTTPTVSNAATFVATYLGRAPPQG
jgi:hypothetical protein